MFQFRRLLVAGLVLMFGQVSPVSALVGIGAHYGIDLTLKMNNKTMEQASFEDLKLNLNGITGPLPSGLPSTISGADLPVFFNRTNFENTGINFGGKIYVDVLPFIDALEVSTNFGVWQYNGVIKYPHDISFNQTNNPSDPLKGWGHVNYDSTAINFASLDPGHSFWGIDKNKTPYAKLHFDATIRKYILQIPPLIKTVKLYGGAGMSIDFATPMLSAKLIEDALGSSFNTQLSYSELNALFSDQTVMKKILDEIINKLMTPHYGCHLALGTMIKLPMIPIGLYVDGRYIIMFDKLDKYVDVGGSGLLINLGVALAF